MIRIEPIWFICVVIAIVSFILLFYFLYFRKKTESFSDTWTFIKIIGYGIIITVIMLVFIFSVIEIYITVGSEEGSESWIFMILNALLIGIYINIIGFTSENVSYLKYIIFIVLIAIAFSGFGYLGILVEFNKPISDILLYTTYQSNSTHAIFFLVYNIVPFTLIYFISYTTEGMD